MAIDYFSKWVEAESYATVGSRQMARFIEKNIIYRYRLPHHVVTDNGVQFKADTEVLLKEYKIEHHCHDPIWGVMTGAREREFS